MSKGRVLSKDAEKWFNSRHRVTIIDGRFVVEDRRTGEAITTRNRYIGMLQYIKNRYVEHCKHELER